MPRKKTETVVVESKPKRTRKTKAKVETTTEQPKPKRTRKKKEPVATQEKKLNPGQLTKEEKLEALPKDKRPIVKFTYDEQSNCYYSDDPTCNYVWIVRRVTKKSDKFIVEGLNYWFNVPKKYRELGEKMIHIPTGKEVLMNCNSWNNTWPGHLSIVMKHPRISKSNLTEEMLSSL